MGVLYTETRKGKKGITLVFVHGNSQNHRFWENQFDDSLFGDYNRVLLDLPGHGYSPKLLNYDVSTITEFVSEALNQFGPILIIAHSLGGH